MMLARRILLLLHSYRYIPRCFHRSGQTANFKVPNSNLKVTPPTHVFGILWQYHPTMRVRWSVIGGRSGRLLIEGFRQVEGYIEDRFPSRWLRSGRAASYINNHRINDHSINDRRC